MAKKLLFILLFSLFIQPLVAQKKVFLEKIRCLSFDKPIKDYLQDPVIRQTIIEDLNTTLLKQQLISLVTTKPVDVDFIPYGTQLLNASPVFEDDDTSHLHLYLDIFEESPGSFFSKADNYTTDSILIKRASTILHLKATLFKNDKSIFFTETLSVVVSTAETPGIGYPYGSQLRYADLTIFPRAFIQLLKASTNILLDQKNEMAIVEIKVQPGFLLDNYLLPKTMNQPRFFVKNVKNISSYNRGGKTELVRMDQPIYEEIMIKGKKPQKYPDDITNAIKATQHFNASDYVFLREECRDVLRDKNYLLKFTVQIDRMKLPEDQSLLLTNFLPGNFHYLFLENDTLAKFSIEKIVPSDSGQVYSNIVTNGYDNSANYRIKTGYQTAPWDVVYSYVIKGNINNQPFSIKCSGNTNTIKEIFLSNKLVCIAQGKFSPEKFVLFDASLSSELLNRLFMIGFNRFFE